MDHAPHVTDPAWLVRERDVPALSSDARSALFTIGNGQHGTRGTHPEERHDAFRGVYLPGLFTRAGYGLIYFLPAPDWLTALITVNGEPCVVDESERVLDMRDGVLRRSATFRAGSVVLSVAEERFASFARPSLLAQRITVTVLEGRSPFEVALGLDGDVRAHRAKYYFPGQLPNVDETGIRLTHIETLAARPDALEVVLVAPQNDRRVAARAVVRQCEGDSLAVMYGTENGRALARYHVPGGGRGRSFSFEKLVTLTADLGEYQSAVEEGAYLHAEVNGHGPRPMDYASLRAAHVSAVTRFWADADVVIVGDDPALRALRYALWSTRISAPDDDGYSSLPAKNLTGDWYRGAVFWDVEMFQLPMLAAVMPERARNHVRYRVRRLESARTLAAQDGYLGARFPWHSYNTGLEEPPLMGGFLYHQQHVSADVAWGIIYCYAITGDTSLLRHGGLETILAVCRFWESRVARDADGSFHIRRVCGPDEDHGLVDDNAFTNRLVAWLLTTADRLLDRIGDPTAGTSVFPWDAAARCGVDDAVRARWREIAAGMYAPQLRGREVMAQFAGFEDYPEPDDQLHLAKGEGSDRRSKQADTLLLFQVLPGEFPPAQVEAHWREYAPLCNQTSSLSLCTYAIIAAQLGRTRDMRKYFQAAIGVDLDDSMGNTCHGVHGAGEGGIWMAVVHGFGGLHVSPDGVEIAPALPTHWESLSYGVFVRGVRLHVVVDRAGCAVQNLGSSPMAVTLGGKEQVIAPGETARTAASAAWRQQSLEAVIFDLDGVLVSTDGLHYRAWKELADSLGIPFDEERNHALRGVSREESLRRLYGDRPLPSEEEFRAQCDRKNARYVELVAGMTPADVLPGALDLLRALRAAGIRVAVSSASKNADAVLERTGLRPFLDAVVDGSAVAASKPDPSGFFLASQRLRVLPWNCLGVEDAESGVEAIHRAGMVAVGVGEQAGGAELTVPSIADLTVEALQALWLATDCPVNPYLERNVQKMKNEENLNWKRA